MSTWQAVKYLSLFQLRRDWLGYLLTFLFMLYTSSLVGFSINDVLQEPQPESGWKGMADAMYVCMLPSFGLLMNQTSFRIWKSNSYQQRLSHYRTLPIPLKVIVLARWLQAGVMVPVNGFIFMVIQYVIGNGVASKVTLPIWLGAGFVWICYGIVASALLIRFELGCSGKRFIIYYTVLALAAIVAVVLLTWLDVHLIDSVLRLVREYPWLTLPLATIAAAVAVRWGTHATQRRIKRVSASA